MIQRLERALRALQRAFSRSEWSARLLGLPKSRGAEDEPGLVLIQIDGLSRTQMEKALSKGRLPFLRKLLEQEHYQLCDHYSGMPASTPAVQGELFYGIKTAVPAFSFVLRDSGRLARMYEPGAAFEIEQRLAKSGGPALLRGGSSYLNIYTGGADESHFCPAGLGWHRVRRVRKALAYPFVALANLYSLLRVAVLMIVELVLAMIDGIAGLFDGHDLLKELKFVPSRVAVTILLRELTTIGVKIDIARGLPVIHLNFLGYDEQAHRRGPSSQFAHWSLKGIDDAIARIWRAAHGATRRRYQVWIYSDHGQEQTIPYARYYRRSIKNAVTAALSHLGVPTEQSVAETRGVQTQRARLLGGAGVQKLLRLAPEERTPYRPSQVTVAAMGPVGMVYTPTPLSTEDADLAARALVDKAHVPMVLHTDTRAGQDGIITAWTAAGRFSLPVDARRVLGQDHPFLEEASRDLIRMCTHPDAGDLVLCGWCSGAVPHSFAVEHGAHAGVAPEELRGFALLPADTVLAPRQHDYLRPIDLRLAALHALKRKPLQVPRAPARPSLRPRSEIVRIMTYNVHSCIGMDGRLSPERIAEVIARYEPDIIALQELDVGRMRTGGIDQAHVIADELNMEYHFHPALQVEEERYGDALLTHLPIRLIKADALPGLPQRPELEPRGALWAAVDIGGVDLQIINTHLGLRPRERLAQAQALLSTEWLAHPDCEDPLVLCGDFNALPNSPVCRRFDQVLQDAQVALSSHRPRKTLFSRFPLARIDHVYFSHGLEVASVAVPSSTLTRVASDHLPLIVELRLRSDSRSRPSA